MSGLALRALAVSPIGLAAFLAALALAAFAVRQGMVAEDAVTLWAGSISAGSGDVPIGRIIASYPTLPFFAAMALDLVTPPSTPGPALLAAGLLGLFACTLFRAFRAADLSPAVATVATFMIALHPALLTACLAGAAEMFLVVFLYMLGNALFELRARTAAPEVMTAALSLLGLAFSHPIGAAVDIAVLPLLLFAVRPSLIANSAPNVLLALVFPTVFALGAFAYVSWVFPGSGWSFLATPAESLAGWAADAARIVPGPLAINAAVAVAIALVLGAPIAPIAIHWVRGRRPLAVPPLVLAGAAIGAAFITVATGFFGDPAPLAAAAPILAAVIVARVPFLPEWRRLLLPLLAAGWIGGLLAIAIASPRAAMQLRAAVNGGIAEHARLDALKLGGATSRIDGVLIDTDNAPVALLGRSRSRGLIGPHDPDFALALLFRRIDAAYVAVPDPHSASGIRDRLNEAFPQLYRDGAPGYRLAYSNKTWRLYARRPATGP
jgi:hypothetical protein